MKIEEMNLPQEDQRNEVGEAEDEMGAREILKSSLPDT